MKVHHVEMCVRHTERILNYFSKNFGFRLLGSRGGLPNGEYNNGWVLSNDFSFIILRKSIGGAADIPTVSTVCNVALQVNDDVESLTESVRKNGGKILKEPTVLQDEMGLVSYSVIGTGFGNIVHTLINKHAYNGQFLPGFRSIEISQTAKNDTDQKNSQTQITKQIDHIAYVCHPGQMDHMIEWYQKCLGLERFYLNRDDCPVQGVIIEDNIGIRLKAAKYKAESNDDENPLFVVFAEPLTSKSENHVKKFLDSHGCPGVEHVAFLTDNILSTMQELKRRGTLFRQYSPNYYNEICKHKEMEIFCQDFELYQKLGILLDVEDRSTNDSVNSGTSFILQMFTPPIFDQEETLFLEIIQRIGAKGLGTANITRIMKAIEKDQRFAEILCKKMY